MAEMIPDRLPTGASAGEKRVFALLQQLPDDIIVYYEPVVARRYPDFVVIIPNTGLLVIEVKGWYPNHIKEANSIDVVISTQGRDERCRHPIRQARDYQHGLMDTARRHPESAALLQRDGAHAGRFIFPFGHLVVLSNCTRPQLEERGLSDVFPARRVIARNELETLSPVGAIERFGSCFDPWWPFGRLTETQVSILRAVIHPEIAILLPARVGVEEQPPLKVLDLRQERNALSLGEGHRLVYGVAGSGKTVILVARARLIACDPQKRVLVLCFNRALAENLQRAFAQSTNVAALNFHEWGRRNGVRFERNGEDADDLEPFGERLLQRLLQGEGEAHIYDAVFIDEAQDFPRSWFLCAKLALKEPDDGDLLIVGDGSQSLYRRRKFSWKEAGINAQGRTINRRFDLDKNYRNTREIMKIAVEFAPTGSEHSDPETGLAIIKPNAETALRSGAAPEMLMAQSLEGEFRVAAQRIGKWLNSGLAPSQIAVLYRANAQKWVDELAAHLGGRTAVHWPHNANFVRPGGAAVCLRTMHSARGLQWRAVLVMRCDMMPFMSDKNTVEQERGLMYVAMTRAEELLAFTCSSLNGFAAEIRQLLDCYRSAA